MRDDGVVRTAYRKRHGESIWHACRNCDGWPTYAEADESLQLPQEDEFCSDCRDLLANAGCHENPS